MKNANLSKMFKGNYNKKYALLMCNDLKGCNEDVKRLEKILTEYDFNIHIKVFCYPKIEIKYFIKYINPLENDLVYIHYSGHGEKRGKMYKNKPELVSSWLNPNNTVVLSSEIDSLLSNINSSVILTTEACHSETFGKHYQGKYPFIFIGTSEINRISRTFSLNGEPYVQLVKKDKELARRLKKKIDQILENPEHYKPLRNILKEKSTSRLFCNNL